MSNEDVYWDEIVDELEEKLKISNELSEKRYRQIEAMTKLLREADSIIACNEDRPDEDQVCDWLTKWREFKFNVEEVREPRYGYMCMVDFDWELGEACGGTRVYPSVEDLKENRKCVEGCGIVKVSTRLERVVQKEKPLREQMELSERDYKKVEDELENPSEPNEKLVEAFTEMSNKEWAEALEKVNKKHGKTLEQLSDKRKRVSEALEEIAEELGYPDLLSEDLPERIGSLKDRPHETT